MQALGAAKQRVLRWSGRTDLQRVVHLAPRSARAATGTALLSYLVSPFTDGRLPASHTNHWECHRIALTLADAGYAVDVIDWRNERFVPRRAYDVVIDIHSNLERLAPHLGEGCVRVLHATGAHWLFQNHAELSRLMALRARRGVVLAPRRLAAPSMAIEHATRATVLGNAFTRATFEHAGKPLHAVPLSTTAEFAWPASRDYGARRRSFIWLGGNGLVHKGLDLVLEAFAKMPDLTLYVCGPVAEEGDFVRAYHQELYATPNIKTLGWVDTASVDFQALLATCLGFVYPSCSEATSGAAVLAMHGALVPVVTAACGADVDDFGVVLERVSVDELQSAVRSVADLPAVELQQRARAAWDFARTRHTRARFAQTYGEFVEQHLA